MPLVRPAGTAGSRPRRARGWVVLALLAATLSGLVPASFGQLPGTAQVADLELTTAAMAPSVPRVGQATNITAVIRNLGPNNAATFDARFEWNGTEPLADGSSFTWPRDADHFLNPVNDTGGPDDSCLSRVTGLARGCSVTAFYVWTPPERKAGAGNVTPRAVVGGAASDPAPDNDVFVLPTFVRLHKLDVVLDSRDSLAKQVRPGHTAFYRLTVHNGGNGVDAVRLRILAPAWPASSVAANGTAAPGPNATLTLGPGETAEALALLTAPASPGNSSVASATIEANVTAAPALGGDAVRLPDTAAKDAAPGNYSYAPLPPPDGLVAPGVPATAEVEVRNLGGAEDAVRWTLDAAPAGWNASLVAEWLGVPGGAGNASRLVVHALGDADLEPGAEAVLHLRAVSFNTGAPAAVNLTLRTDAPDFTIARVDLDRAQVYRGDIVEVHLDLRNIGPVPQPKPARIALYALPLEEPGAVEERVASKLLSGLGAGVAQPLAFPWDTGTHTGRVRLRAVADADQNIPEVHEDNNEATLEVTLRIAALQAHAAPDRNARPGETLAYENGTFSVTNLGNAPEEVRIALTTPHGWINDSRIEVVAAGATHNVPLTLKVPLLPGTLLEDLVLAAELVHHNATRAEAGSRVLIVDNEPPVLASLSVPARATLGETATIKAVLRDAVGVREAAAMLQMPNGTVRAAPMHLVGADVWEAGVVFTVPGAVHVWVRAVDATPANHTLDATSDTRTVDVGVDTAPLIELLEPRDGSSIRSGSLLRFRVTDVHGIASVAVEGGGRTVEIGEPYAVSTSGWPPGDQEVRVTATNRFGLEDAATFHVTIDDTAPLVREATVRPARPAPGAAFAVEAKTSLDARVGAVRAQRDGRTLQEVPATVGLGLLNASLTLSEAGKYTLTITSQDAAGNTGTLDVQVDVGSGLPGAGAGSAIAVLGAVAAALGFPRAAAKRKR